MFSLLGFQDIALFWLSHCFPGHVFLGFSLSHPLNAGVTQGLSSQTYFLSKLPPLWPSHWVLSFKIPTIRAPLNSRLIFPAAYLTSSLQCVIDISHFTCLRPNSPLRCFPSKNDTPLEFPISLIDNSILQVIPDFSLFLTPRLLSISKSCWLYFKILYIHI